MIDKNDKQTRDAFTPRRGRPVTGNAMTAAERKRAQRQRDQELYNTVLSGTQEEAAAALSEMSVDALAQGLAAVVKSGKALWFDDFANELRKRAKEA